MDTLTFEHFVTARAGLQRRAMDMRARRFGRKIEGRAFPDPDIMAILPLNDPPAPPLAFHMIYRAESRYTGRCVTLRRLREEITEVRLTGICHLRAATRMFLASRIEELTDLATGEVFDDALGYFRRHPLLDHMNASDAAALGPETLLLQDCRDEIVILSFVGAADGELDADEHEMIVRHVLMRADEPVSEGVIRRRLGNWIPDEFAFDRALARLCAGEGDARALMASMRRVIDADGEIDAEEVAFATEIERRLRAAGRLG